MSSPPRRVPRKPPSIAEIQRRKSLTPPDHCERCGLTLDRVLILVWLVIAERGAWLCPECRGFYDTLTR